MQEVRGSRNGKVDERGVGKLPIQNIHIQKHQYREQHNITYNGVRFATYYDEYDVIQVNGDRVVIGIGNTVTAAVNAANIAKDEEIAEAPADAEVPTDIPTQEETENAHGFKVGQKVKVINAYDYYGNMFKCWYSKYDVIEVKNDRIVIGIGNTVTAAVNAANLAAA